MTPLSFTLAVFGISFAAGFGGALLGLGGGIVVVPALTILLGIDIRFAIGASIVSVIATSSGAAAAYVRERITNLRVAMFLEIATASGALAGAILAGWIDRRWLHIVFAVVLFYSALAMLARLRKSPSRPSRPSAVTPPDAWADRLRLHGSYFDPALGVEVRYRVARSRVGLALMFVAGAVSGLLGIGSGALKVPAMDLAMGLPMKASTATSNFMIGVTAAATAGVYFARGDIEPFVAAPVAVGVLIGALVGSRLLPHVRGRWIRLAFAGVLVFVAGGMLLQGIR